MSIENVLTLGLAAAILVTAAVLRSFVVGAARLFFKLSGREIPWRDRTAEASAARRPRRPAARPVLEALGSVGRRTVPVPAILGTWMRSAGRRTVPVPAILGTWMRSAGRRTVPVPAILGTWMRSAGSGIVYGLAILGTWMRSAGTFIAGASVSAYGWLRPRVASGAEKGLTSASRSIKSATIVTVASGQHLGRVTAQRLREIAGERAARAPEEEEPPDARVIVLDAEWDPLTDPLEDEPASNVR